MGLEHMPWLTITIFLPTVGAVLLVAFGRSSGQGARVVSLVFSILTAVLSVGLAVGFNGASPDFQLEDPQVPWVPSLGINYHVALDGISLWLFLLTTFLSVIAVLGSWTSITQHAPVFFICLLLLETAMLGVFAAVDLVLFYVFWEAMLVPMYFIIGVWGGERRLYAAIKFFIYTFIGGVLMLAGILILYFSLPPMERTFSIPELLGIAPNLPGDLQLLLFVLFGLGFAIKVPLFPFHTWLPDAHVEAPTSGSVILAGVLLKMGAYGFLRLCVGFFPVATEMLGPVIMWLSVIGILYGGAAAMWQRDIKRLIAYSSVSHLGFVMLGVFALNAMSIQGAVLQMVNHGLSTGALFLLVGMIYERRHTRMIDDYGGLWEEVPVYSRIFLVVALSSIGLPGLNGFIGELLTLMGTFASEWAQARLWAILGCLGVIVAACYMLWMYKRVFYGTPKPYRGGPMKDINRVEATAAVMLLAGIVWLGVYPIPVLRSVGPAATMVVKRFDTSRGALRGSQPLASMAPEIVPLAGTELPAASPEGDE